MAAPAVIPDPTAEYTALAPREGESGLDALTRIGDGIVQEFQGSDTRDARRNKKLPRQLAALVALRAQGFDNREIADRLRVKPQKLRQLIAKARKEYGWSDLGDTLTHVAVPQAIDNVVRHLDHEGTDMALRNGQSVMTRTLLHGVGVLKTHSAVKQESKNETTNTLRVEIVLPELPPGDQGPDVSAGVVMATPRHALPAPHPTPAATHIVDGQVIDG